MVKWWHISANRSFEKQVLATYINHSRHLIPDGIHRHESMTEEKPYSPFMVSAKQEILAETSLMDKQTVKDYCRGGVQILVIRLVKVNLSLCFVFALMYAVSVIYIRKFGVTSTREIESNSLKFDHRSKVCIETFNASLDDNLRFVERYPRGVADDYMLKLGLNLNSPKDVVAFPVIVTAFHKIHYTEAMGLFRSIHQYILRNQKYNSQAKVIVYDIGLTGRQLGKLKAKCLCEVRKFPFKNLPPHVQQIDNFAYKPIIVQMLLMEFGFVWWVDTSVRFTSTNLDSAISFAVRNSVLFYVTHDISKSNTVARQTDAQTFSFLKEDVCKFRNFSEAVAGFVLFYSNNVTRILVSAWARCALNRECIAPESTYLKKTCHLEQMQDGRCHKFDQSVLSILIRRIYRDTDHHPVDDSLNKIFVIKKGELDHYFEKCVPMLKCLS